MNFFGSFFVLYATVVSPSQFAYRVRKNWERYPIAKRDFEIVINPATYQTA